MDRPIHPFLLLVKKIHPKTVWNSQQKIFRIGLAWIPILSGCSLRATYNRPDLSS